MRQTKNTVVTVGRTFLFAEECDDGVVNVDPHESFAFQSGLAA